MLKFRSCAWHDITHSWEFHLSLASSAAGSSRRCSRTLASTWQFGRSKQEFRFLIPFPNLFLLTRFSGMQPESRASVKVIINIFLWNCSFFHSSFFNLVYITSSTQAIGRCIKKDEGGWTTQTHRAWRSAGGLVSWNCPVVNNSWCKCGQLWSWGFFWNTYDQ